METIQYCTICLYNSTLSGISFDFDGKCNYCHQIDQIKSIYQPTIEVGKALLDKIISEIKLKGQGKKYDCVVGISGGTDSSFLLMKCIDWGLKPLAVHYDNTWNSATASQNIYTITNKLKVDLFTYVVDYAESNDLKLSFLKARVREFDADTDIAFIQTLRSVASKHRIRYILEGHSFLTEGLTPVGINYLDGAYVRDIHKKFGSIKLRTFPNMTLVQFLKWILFFRQKFIRPLWYIPYSKEEARKELIERLGWKYYGGHHLENYSSNFAHSVWLPEKFNLDYRILTLAADVREGRIRKTTGLHDLLSARHKQADLSKYLQARLDLSSQELVTLITGQQRTWKEFKTYKKFFESFRFVFYAFAKFNLVPMSFYIKYCKKDKIR
jgi:hypothetical protein